jgi:hypothetical protein
VKFGNRIMITQCDVVFTHVGDVTASGRVTWSWDLWDLCRLAGLKCYYSSLNSYAQVHVTAVTAEGMMNTSRAERDVFIMRTISR